MRISNGTTGGSCILRVLGPCQALQCDLQYIYFNDLLHSKASVHTARD